MTDNNIQVSLSKLEFEDIKLPTYTENKAKGYISYGEKNNYPNYLLGLYDGSGKHGAIVNGKADFIIGNGFAFVEEDEAANERAKNFLEKANTDGESLEEVISKVVLDVEIFGGGYIEVLYNRKGQVSEVRHIDYSLVRVGIDPKKLYYSENWHNESNGVISENSKATIKTLDVFDPANKKGKQVLVIREYKPGKDPYPTPNYFANLRYTQIDICIGEYHLSGITNGVFGSKMINFNNGIPEADQQKKVETKINGKFAGSKNAGKAIITFNKSAENAPTVVDISGTELDKHFNLLNETVEGHIFSSHRVTNPEIFGIPRKGAFSSNAELMQSVELFENTYVNKKRRIIEKHVNLILSQNGFNEIYLQKSDPIKLQLSEATMAANLTEDEIRETLGKKPREQEAESKRGSRSIIKSINALPASVAAKVLATMTDNEVRSLARLPAIAGGDNLPSDNPTPAAFSAVEPDDDKDILVFAEFGTQKDKFDIIESRRGDFENDFKFYKQYFATVKELSAQQKSIIDLIVKDSKITPDSIAKALGVSVKVVDGLLKGLEKSGLIKTNTTGKGVDEQQTRTATDGAKDSIGNDGDGETTSIKVMYSYEGPKDSRNRPFCAKVLELDRMYTREDIESISAKLGYSVWHRRGGWYRAPGSSEARPYCRHFWQTNTVISKS